MYLLIGYKGIEPSTIMRTDSIQLATTEYLSYEDDLINNPSEMKPEERFDYIELYFKETLLETCFREDECDRCGYHDEMVCQSNGCVNYEPLD